MDIDTSSELTAYCENFLFSELCWGKAMVAYGMSQQRKKEESERLRGERDQTAIHISNIDQTVSLFSLKNLIFYIFFKCLLQHFQIILGAVKIVARERTMKLLDVHNFSVSQIYACSFTVQMPR